MFINATQNGTLLVTPGTENVVYKIDSSTLALVGGVSNPGGNRNGGVQGLAGGSLLVTSSSGVHQISAAGTIVGTYNRTLSGDWIGVSSFTPSTFFAVSDFGEVSSFNLGTFAPVGSFNTGFNATDIAVYTLPEPSTWIGLASGLAVFALRRGRAHASLRLVNPNVL